MKYSYSKSTPHQGYQSSPPSRVSPVPAASFSGKTGGGGLFPFLPNLAPTPEPTPEEYAQEGYGEGYGELANHAEQLAEASSELKRANAASEGAEGKKDETVEQPNSPNFPKITAEKDRILYSFGEGGSSGYAPDAVYSGSGSDILPDRIYASDKTNRIPDMVYGGRGADELPDFVYEDNRGDVLPDFVYGGQSADNLPDMVYGDNRSDAMRWRSFEDVYDELPTQVVSGKVGGQDKDTVKPATAQVGTPLKTQGTVNLKNVNNLPQMDTSMFKAPEHQPSMLEKFVDYAVEYHHDKMEHPLREIGIQTAASLVALPLASAAVQSLAPAVASVAAPVVNNITKLVPQASQTMQKVTQSAPVANNIVNFADYANKAPAAASSVQKVAAGIAASTASLASALSAKAKPVGWDSNTQQYNSVSSAVPLGGIGR